LLIQLPEHERQIDAFVKACHRVAEYNLVRCSSGNMSFRLDDKLALISASRTWLADITKQQVAICNISDGKSTNELKPSIESSFHFGILRNRPDVNVVLHFQSPYATAIACGQVSDYDFGIIVEVPFYIGRPTVIEYMQPGSAELAEAVVAAMEKCNMVILRNHGLVTVGGDFNEAIQRAVFFELACQILICQKNPKHLSQSQFDKLCGFSNGI
jgi:ribulose-5-phosphate 4-epimerase/fuculose-1-phosphate aldolase